MNSTPDANFLEAIRLSELRQIEDILKNVVASTARILEIGAGTGWQARELAARGYAVSAIDIPTSNHGKGRIWPIIDFDGRHIPFPDNSFDVVYSSNVLEHVEDIDTLNIEIIRVLRSDGFAIHYVPTSAWRGWSLAAFYPALLRDTLRRVARRLAPDRSGPIAAPTVPVTPAGSVLPAPQHRHTSVLRKVVRRIVPHAHGAVGTSISELVRFSRRSWNDFFTSRGWHIVTYNLNGLFLTGDMMLGYRLSIERRKRLSRALGCTAHLYVLKRQLGPQIRR